MASEAKMPKLLSRAFVDTPKDPKAIAVVKLVKKHAAPMCRTDR
jgi:hypothetical protein